MIVKNKNLPKLTAHFAINTEIGLPTEDGFVGRYMERRKVGDELTIFIAKEDCRLLMYGDSGSFVKVGEQLRGAMPEELCAKFKKGEIIRKGDWVRDPDSFKYIVPEKRKIKIITRSKNGHEYYEI